MASKFRIGAKRKNSFLSQRGQFFSPDLILAVVVFVGVMFLFYNASAVIFTQVSLMESRKQLEENSHVAIRSLISTPGEPFDWEIHNLADINSFGLIKSKGVLDANKVATFLSLLDSNYVFVKSKAGFGKYDFMMELLDSRGESVARDGNVVSPVSLKFIYERLIYYNGQPSVFRGVVSYGE